MVVVLRKLCHEHLREKEEEENKKRRGRKGDLVVTKYICTTTDTRYAGNHCLDFFIHRSILQKLLYYINNGLKIQRFLLFDF